MWQKDRSADAAGQLENLKELIRSMEQFPDLAGFLEHVSLVMEAETAEQGRESLDHDAARRQGGLSSTWCFCRAGRRAVSPSALARRERPRRASRRAPPHLCRHHPGQAQSAHQASRHQPAHSRAVADDDPVAFSRRSAGRACRGGRGAGRELLQPCGVAVRPHGSFTGSSYATPGWRRAQERGPARGTPAARRGPMTIEGELVAKSSAKSGFSVGARVFHLKFGPGTVALVDGNKLYGGQELL